MSEQVPARSSGQFMPGQSGNPSGRPKGSKNRVNQLKLELEQSLREDPIVSKKVRSIFMQMLNMAEAGNEKMIRLVMEKFISGASLDAAENDGPTEFVFKIIRADQENNPTKVIEGEYEEVQQNAGRSEEAESSPDAGHS